MKREGRVEEVRFSMKKIFLEVNVHRQVSCNFLQQHVAFKWRTNQMIMTQVVKSKFIQMYILSPLLVLLILFNYIAVIFGSEEFSQIDSAQFVQYGVFLFFYLLCISKVYVFCFFF